MKSIMTGALAAILVVAFLACGDDDDSGVSRTATPAAGQATINPGDFTTSISNTFFPIGGQSRLVFEGEEIDPETGDAIETRVEMTVLNDEKTVAGVKVLVVRDEAFEDGELVESTLDYFAQHKDGSVYYFGEDVENYEDGELLNTDGSWLAGEGDNQPGIIMPPDPAVGEKFQQEKAPGIAEDEMTVKSVTESVTVPAGTFTGCVKTEDVNPLDANGHIEFKYYCPEVGFALEEFDEGRLELVSFE
jgi:hypothetical protein